MLSMEIDNRHKDVFQNQHDYMYTAITFLKDEND